MAIVPSGKARLMKAQVINSPFINPEERGRPSSVGSPYPPPSEEKRPVLETEQEMDEDIGGTESFGEPESDGKEISNPQKKKTLTSYIFKKLEEWGYPGRRLQEFKSKFVKESVSPDGIKDIQVEIPDKKYPDSSGYTDTIENEELSEISQEVSKMFGLNFNGAERSDGKWTIKFTSIKKTEPSEDEINRDNLDEIYGHPTGSKKEQKAVQAFTIQEMINGSKSAIVNKLKKINGA
jgi:hypothetical protein